MRNYSSLPLSRGFRCEGRRRSSVCIFSASWLSACCCHTFFKRKAASSRRVPSDIRVSRPRRHSIDDGPCFSRQLAAEIRLGTGFLPFDTRYLTHVYPLPNPISL